MTDQQQQQPEGTKDAAGTGSNLTASHVLGEIVWLMARSPTHRHFAFADLEWMILPPMKLGQCRVFHGEKAQPVGIALWAWLSEEAEQKLDAGGNRLRPDEWKSGDRLWLVDLVAPDATEENQLTQKMLSDLLRVLAPQLGNARDGKLQFHRTDPRKGERQVIRIGARA